MSDLTILFTTDPLKLTTENIDEIIEYFRGARAKYLAGEKSAGSPKSMKEKKPKAAKAEGDIDISLLDL